MRSSPPCRIPPLPPSSLFSFFPLSVPPFFPFLPSPPSLFSPPPPLAPRSGCPLACRRLDGRRARRPERWCRPARRPGRRRPSRVRPRRWPPGRRGPCGAARFEGLARVSRRLAGGCAGGRRRPGRTPGRPPCSPGPRPARRGGRPRRCRRRSGPQRGPVRGDDPHEAPRGSHPKRCPEGAANRRARPVWLAYQAADLERGLQVGVKESQAWTSSATHSTWWVIGYWSKARMSASVVAELLEPLDVPGQGRRVARHVHDPGRPQARHPLHDPRPRPARGRVGHHEVGALDLQPVERLLDPATLEGHLGDALQVPARVLHRLGLGLDPAARPPDEADGLGEAGREQARAAVEVQGPLPRLRLGEVEDRRRAGSRPRRGGPARSRWPTPGSRGRPPAR